jgi:hypothetical protein
VTTNCEGQFLQHMACFLCSYVMVYKCFYKEFSNCNYGRIENKCSMGNSTKHMVKDFRLFFCFGCILGNVLLNNMEGEE